MSDNAPPPPTPPEPPAAAWHPDHGPLSLTTGCLARSGPPPFTSTSCLHARSHRTSTVPKDSPETLDLLRLGLLHILSRAPHLQAGSTANTAVSSTPHLSVPAPHPSPTAPHCVPKLQAPRSFSPNSLAGMSLTGVQYVCFMQNLRTAKSANLKVPVGEFCVTQPVTPNPVRNVIFTMSSSLDSGPALSNVVAT